MDGHRKVRAGAAARGGGSAARRCRQRAGAARAERGRRARRGVRRGIQLYDFSSYLQPTARVRSPVPAPPARADAELRRAARADDAGRAPGARLRVAAVQGHPQRRALRLPGQSVPDARPPAAPVNLAGLQALKALGDKYGIRFPGRHGNLPETNWDNQIAASRILGQTHLGESGLPDNTNGYNTWDRLLATAQQLNRLGKRSVEAGLGPAYFHNHNDEFSRRYTDAGASCPTTSTAPAARARGSSSWIAPTRAGSWRRSTSAGPSAAPPSARRRTRPPAWPT